ncbi:MAG: hypothetical protein ACKPKO_64365, partial [Candidatus Fonsibacter sp.]
MLTEYRCREGLNCYPRLKVTSPRMVAITSVYGGQKVEEMGRRRSEMPYILRVSDVMVCFRPFQMLTMTLRSRSY